ncbi:enoyl-CoA hydratase [Pseudorhodoplanes sp.]|uniref:enoyl-CoA hydratase n=1 Tax=Pseudorhodoplanes sp. TaxID=1934341 RepID=UPI002C92DA42|nr:enoyl-CoA hydratase [Pseudorhodoplanes sp.]HWV51335.1 enoyl-CoA hydratase [Pseudorhodoplanes sp.]
MNVHARPDSATILLREDRDGIALLTLNNPAARNALSEELIAALSAAFDAIGREAAIRAVIVAANGPAFSAGHDLKQLTARRSDPDGGKAYFRQIMTSCSDMMQKIIAIPQPVIACVSGVATAAGCQLVATCDLAIASTEARFATPGVDIGLFCSTPMVALTRNIPRKNAMHMLLTGEPVSAEEAARLGLVNRVVPKGAELDASFALARTVASKSRATVKIGKQAFYRQAELSLADAYAYASEVMTENMMTHDANEGICAFIEKRDAAWEDR